VSADLFTEKIMGFINITCIDDWLRELIGSYELEKHFSG
jgi:hypothetical protein